MSWLSYVNAYSVFHTPFKILGKFKKYWKYTHLEHSTLKQVTSLWRPPLKNPGHWGNFRFYWVLITTKRHHQNLWNTPVKESPSVSFISLFSFCLKAMLEPFHTNVIDWSTKNLIRKYCYGCSYCNLFICCQVHWLSNRYTSKEHINSMEYTA